MPSTVLTKTFRNGSCYGKQLSGMYPHSGFVAGWKPENEPQYFGHCGSFLLPFPAGN
jgi:hypothetical protein